MFDLGKVSHLQITQTRLGQSYNPQGLTQSSELVVGEYGCALKGFANQLIHDVHHSLYGDGKGGERLVINFTSNYRTLGNKHGLHSVPIGSMAENILVENRFALVEAMLTGRTLCIEGDTRVVRLGDFKALEPCLSFARFVCKDLIGPDRARDSVDRTRIQRTLATLRGGMRGFSCRVIGPGNIIHSGAKVWHD